MSDIMLSTVCWYCSGFKVVHLCIILLLMAFIRAMVAFFFFSRCFVKVAQISSTLAVQ